MKVERLHQSEPTPVKSTETGLGSALRKKYNCHPEHYQSDNYQHNQSAVETFLGNAAVSKSQLCVEISTNERAPIVGQRDLSRQNSHLRLLLTVLGSAKILEMYFSGTSSLLLPILVPGILANRVAGVAQAALDEKFGLGRKF